MTMYALFGSFTERLSAAGEIYAEQVPWLTAIFLVARIASKVIAKVEETSGPLTGWWAIVKVVANALALMGPPDPAIAELKAERRVVANAGSVKIGPTRTAWVTTTTPDDDGLFKTTTTNFAPMAGRRRDERPLVRKLIQREARREGIKLTAEMEDAAIAELKIRHHRRLDEAGDSEEGRKFRGRFADLLEWLVAHREEILAVIRLVITIFAATDSPEDSE